MKYSLLLLFLFSSIFWANAQEMDSILNKAIYKGMSCNDNKDYTGAIESLLPIKDKILQHSNLKIQYVYYWQLGLSYFNTADYAKATPNLLEADKIIQETPMNEDTSNYILPKIFLGDAYLQMNQPKDAEVQYMAAIDFAKKQQLSHIYITTLLNTLGMIYYRYNDYNKAESIILEAKDVIIQMGKKISNYAATICNLGSIYIAIGKYNDAEVLFLEAKAIYKNILSSTPTQFALSDYATSLNNLALLYTKKGEYNKAEPLMIEAKTIGEKVLGKTHPDYATSLNNLASLYDDMGEYTKAEPLLMEAKAIREKVLGKTHPDYATSLNSLAILYEKTGEYSKAEQLLIDAKTILEKVLGKMHPDYAASLMNLALLYTKKGEYNKAEPLMIEAKTIGEKVLGKTHPDYATSLMNLALLYEETGEYSKAEQLLIEAKTIQEKVLGKAHPNYAASLNNLASLYKKTGEYSKAEQLLIDAKTILEKVLGKEHPDYATSLNNLASSYTETGEYTKAEPLLIESKEITEKVLGKTHPDYAISVFNLAVLYKDMGDYDKAEPLLLEAKTIFEKVLGKMHPDYTANLNYLAVVYKNTGNYDKAITIDKESIPLVIQQIVQNFRFMSSRQRHLFWNTRMDKLEFTYNIANQHPDSEIIKQAYDNALFAKGLLLRTNREVQDAILSSGNEALKQQWASLRELRQQISALQTKASVANRAYIEGLENRADSLDKCLTAGSATYRQSKEDLKTNWQTVKAGLSPGEAAIEFVRFNYYRKQWTDSVLYAAVMLRPEWKEPVYVPLFEEKQLSALLAKQDTTPATADYIKEVYTNRGSELYHLVWHRLQPYLDGVQTVYYSPDGLLHQVALSALPADSLHLLSDQFALHLVSSTSEITRLKTAKACIPKDESASLFGGIRYDAGQEELQAAAKPYQHDELLASHFIASNKERSASWSYLDGTRVEVNSIAGYMKRNGIPYSLYSGLDANEEAFKSLSGKPVKIIHLATHGFFLADEKAVHNNDFLQRLGQDNVKVFKNPLLRSGLLLAGANRAWTNNEMVTGIEDGILTADEIADLDLSKTELVVLSACETGLGEVQNSEGVFGLQRAFKLAGVKSLIMSLWKVPDEATSKLMNLFYQTWLSGKTRQEAFKAAQQAVRAEYNNPYYWAGFVMMD